MNKNKMKVYIVKYCYGAYEDFTQSIVAIFDNKKTAEKFVEQEKQAMEKWDKFIDKCYSCGKKAKCKLASNNESCEYRLDFHDDFWGGSYYIKEELMYFSLEDVKSVAQREFGGMNIADREKYI